MKVRTKAFLQVLAAMAALVGVILFLELIFGKYGFVIYMGALCAYLIYLMYDMRVGALEREQDEIVDKLKQ